MSYRQPNKQNDHIFVHGGKGDWEQQALRRQRNLNYAIRVVSTSFLVTFNLFRNIYGWLFPSNEEVIALGREINEYGQEENVVGIPTEVMKRHVHIVGGTGRGKTTTMVNMLIQLMHLGRSIILIDVKGDLADTVLKFVPPHRAEDVILFDPCDAKYPIAWNIFQLDKQEDKSRLAGEILLVIQKLMGDSWGPRLDSLLRHAIIALLHFPGATFLDLYYFFIDEAFRETVVAKVTDTFIREFWESTFASWSSSLQAVSINPVLNKIEPFLAHEMARNILGQPNSAFSLREVMDSGKILIVRIPQGALGEDLSRLIGGLLVTKLHMEILGRLNLPVGQRRPVILAIDEFQEIATESFEQTLSLIRSSGGSCLLANQHLGQLPTKLSQSLDHNCAVRLTGHKEGNLHLIEFDLLEDIDQPKFFIRPLLPPVDPSDEVAESIRTLSQIRYGTELEDVQRLLQLRHERRTKYAAAYKVQKEKELEAQKQARSWAKPGNQQPVPYQSPIPKAPQTQRPQAQGTGSSKPSVLQHGRKTNQTTQATQKGKSNRSPKSGGNTP